MSISYIRKEFEAIADLIDKKNKDYGDAFAEATKLFRDYPASKIYEKTKRIIQLSKDGNAVQGEGLTDALRDCIGYCVLYLDHLDWMDKARNGFSGEVELDAKTGGPRFLGFVRVKTNLTGHPKEIMNHLGGKIVPIVDIVTSAGKPVFKVGVHKDGYEWAFFREDELEFSDNTEHNENNS